MKKAIVIFIISMTLIIGGGLLTFSELTKWNTTDQTFESVGYQTQTVSKTIDISNYTESSITDHVAYNNYEFEFYSELGTRVVIDKNQPEGSLDYKLVYYPEFGECQIEIEDFGLEDDNYFKNNPRNNHHRRPRSSNHMMNNYSNHMNRPGVFYTDEFQKDEKAHLNLNSNCYMGGYNSFRFADNFINYDKLKTIMKLKKFPVNIQEVIITINPNDESKLIK